MEQPMNSATTFGHDSMKTPLLTGYNTTNNQQVMNNQQQIVNNNNNNNNNTTVVAVGLGGGAAPQPQQAIYISRDNSGEHAAPMTLFIVGFCFPLLLWFIGSFWACSVNQRARSWGIANLVFFLMGLIGLVGFVLWLFVF